MSAKSLCNFQISRRTIVRHYLYEELRLQGLCLLTFPWKSCFSKSVFQFFLGCVVAYIYVCACVCVWAHSLCAGVNKIWGHSSLRKSFVVWLEEKKAMFSILIWLLLGESSAFLRTPLITERSGHQMESSALGCSVLILCIYGTVA